MLTEEQGFAQVQGINVYDVVVVSQIIEKLLRGGLVTGKELGHVSALRGKLHKIVQSTIGIDLDNPEKEIRETKDDSE
jgi:hypothetical protein